MTVQARQAADTIRSLVPNFSPGTGIILGSGSGDVVQKLESTTTISYQELPGFPRGQSVAGHAGNLVLGRLNGVKVACLQGRAHYYQGYDSEVIKTMVRTLKALGCDRLLITNAAGSLQEQVGPGSLVLVNDHINLQFNNPLVGDNNEEWGPRFNPMNDAYDPKWRQYILEQAKRLNIALQEGVYLGVLGPSYETPAEIRAFKSLGANVVGMSTVAEVIVARHCGLDVAAISVVSNYAAGLVKDAPSHEEVLCYAALAGETLSRLIQASIKL